MRRFALPDGGRHRGVRRQGFRNPQERGNRLAVAVAQQNRPIRHLETQDEKWPPQPFSGLVAAATASGDTVVSQDINVLALVKGAERYVFLYDDASRAETLRTLGRFASNPELSFTWYDAAVLSQKIRHDSHKYVSASRFELPLPSDMDEYC